ncbi:MAG: endolytic transglycosylase MltG [Nocardiopsaceae bacterium]|nr:endolytic transglycosylase MltG [Nocardiopsaceae bacterium]
MSDNEPYDDRYERRGRRRRERERGPDPLTDPWPQRPSRRRSQEDPLTDPWPRRPTSGRPQNDPLTDPWRAETPVPRYEESGPATGGWDRREAARPRPEDQWRAQRSRSSAGQETAGWADPAPSQPLDPILDAPRNRQRHPRRGADRASGGADTDPLSASRVGGEVSAEADRGRQTGRRASRDGDPRPREDYAPRGHRHRRPEAERREDVGDPPLPARGHGQVDDRPRARRRAADAPPREEPREPNPWDPQEGEPELEPAAPRVLDFDSVPVRRKRARGMDEGGGDRAPGRRRRSAPAEETGRFEEGDGAEEPARRGSVPADDDGEDGAADRGRRSRQGRGRRSRSSRASGKAVRKRRGRRGRKGVVVVAIVALTAVIGGGGYVLARDYVFPPDFDGEGSGEVEVAVEDGASGAVIAEALEEKGVVASSRAFINALGDHGGEITPGTYRLRSQMSGEAAVAMLLDPDARIGVRVTIREGLRAERILEELSEKGGLPAEDLEAAYADEEGLGLPPYAEKGAEGYLFPDTYMVDRDAEAHEVLKKMVDRYKTAAEEIGLEQRAAEAGLTPNEAVSLAAIIQAEAGTVEDMPKISEVVYNRLEEGMNLKMDSTCFYAIEEYGIAMNSTQQQKCRESESGYETYFSEGLPAGPIVSPGKDALEAALEPSDDGWLYFVTTDPENSVTEFAKTEAQFFELRDEFNRNQGGG